MNLNKKRLFIALNLILPLHSYAGPVEHKNIIAIVDACSTGVYLAPLLNGLGFDVTHVTSELGRVSNIQPSGKDFIENIQYFGDISPVVQRLSKNNVIAVIAGCESGVFLADELSNSLHLPTSNSLNKSRARREKFLMQESLLEAKVSYIKQLKSDKIEDILNWVKTEKIMPVVLKPVASAGTDNVIFCYSESDIRHAFDRIMNSRNVFKEKNNVVLVQEKIIGQEYMVNSVSSYGKHYIAEIWRIHKKVVKNSPLYDYAELVSPSEWEFGSLKNYVSSVLNALEIHHGPGHSEVIITKERGPILIETAARLGGGNDPSAALEATGLSQASLVVDSYINPEKFNQIYNQGYSEYKKHALVSYLVSDSKGTIKKSIAKNEIFTLPGFHGLWLDLFIGEKMVVTEDAETIPGSVFFVGQDMQTLKDSHEQIRFLEKNGLYKDML
jgi:biotin carboxylase